MTLHLLERGLVQVYTGNGKGKTTAALGLAFRAVGRKLRVCMIQFMKGNEPCGEHLAATLLAPYLTIIQTGHKGWIGKKTPGPEVTTSARKAFEMAREVVADAAYDLVILDEINSAVSHGLVTVEELLQLIKDKDKHMELVLTGRNAAPEILEVADLATEMREIKHYYKAGIPARIGIEK